MSAEEEYVEEHIKAAEHYREMAKHHVVVALSLQEGEMSIVDAESYFNIDSDLDRIRSDLYPGDGYYDRAQSFLEEGVFPV